MMLGAHLRRLLMGGAVGALVALAGCGPGSCTLIGCSDGLNIELAGKFEVGKTYDVVISTMTVTPEVVPVAHCTLIRPAENSWDVRCASAHSHADGGRTVRFLGSSLTNVVVTVSSGGTQLGQQMHQAKYTTEEINGPGCGTCTSAWVEVTVP